MNRTQKLLLAGAVGVLSILGSARLFGSLVIPLPLDQHVGASAAVFRGTVLAMSAYTDPADGLIYTRTLFRVDEPLLGTLPDVLKVVHRGGQVAGRDDFSGLSPRLRPGGEYLMFVMRRKDGKLTCTQGSASAMPLTRTTTAKTADFVPLDGALLSNVRMIISHSSIPGSDVTDQAGPADTRLVTGLIVDGNGISSRFLPQDRGETISYLIDADNLPTGITLTQATNAVQQALNTWIAVTSLKFKFEGFQSFGVGADTITSDDDKLRIQLHDNYNRINSPGVLGIGGRSSLSSPVPGARWDLGGNVAGNEFYKTGCGYVVLERTNVSMQNLATFTEVLCHEIGHALSMAHSSENPSELNNTLKQSIMYYAAHADGRGATLGSYDPPVIQQAYPSNNTAPWSYSRVMDIITIPIGAPNLPGINEVELRGYDLQSTSLTVAVTNDTGNSVGNFSLAGTLLKFTPSGLIGGARLDPASGFFYQQINVRFSDGTNGSPAISARVISLNPDQNPAPPLASDGLPDDWMTTYFGHSNPQSGDKSRAIDDYDGDGLINLQEYRAGMDPTSAASAQRIISFTPTSLQWQAKPYELYEILSSSNLTTWTRAINPIVPTSSTGVATGFISNAVQRYFRVLKVP